MAASSSQGQGIELFPPSACFRSKLLRALETAGQKVLVYTLQRGTPSKSTSDPLNQYLASLSTGSKALYIKLSNKVAKKYFNNTDMNSITADPSCEHFDITLLYKAIMVACEDWQDDDAAGKSVKKIKDMRNEVIHEVYRTIDEGYFLTKVKEIKEACSNALCAVRVKYNCDLTEYNTLKDDLTKIIEDIKQVKLSEEEILKSCMSTLVPLFKDEVDEQLKCNLKNIKFIDPLSFLSGHENIRVDVEDVFMKIIILEGENIREENTVHPLKLLRHTQSGCLPPSPHLTLVEGEAGSGKTTLLKYTISEYLKEETDRRMEGLDHYDLLVWVVCREETSKTLENLLKRLLPDACHKYGNLVMPLLKKSRVLILIDGLDEQDGSRHLVKDILCQGKDCPTFTLMATSRPEAIQTMKADTPTNFTMSHLQLDGVSTDDRTELSLRYYRLLCGNNPRNDDRLRDLMGHIGWKAMFRLPLNIVFLAKLLAEESNFSVVDESELYQNIVNWCVEKLRMRLLRQLDMSQIKLDIYIKNILKESYKISLQRLIQGKIYISDDDVLSIVELCTKFKLPDTEFLQALYSLRRHVTADGMRHLKYYYPHKGLQDFMAARHIIESLDNNRERDIRSMLQDTTQGQQVQVPPLRNMFQHLLRLISQDETMTKAMKETVSLIQESGVCNTKGWLGLLADTKVNDQILKTVAQQIIHSRSGDSDKEVIVQDGTVEIASVLLPLIETTKEISLHLFRDRRETESFFKTLNNNKLTKIHLWHHFTRPRLGVYSDHWLRLAPKSHLIWFVGHLDGAHLASLPRHLKLLHVSVSCTGHAKSFIPSLANLRVNCPELVVLTVFVPLSTITSPLSTSVPGGVASYGVALNVGDVKDEKIELACKILASLSPSDGRGYYELSFSRASLGIDGWKRLIERLASYKISVKDNLQGPMTLTADEERQLKIFTKSKLKCNFQRIDYSTW